MGLEAVGARGGSLPAAAWPHWLARGVGSVRTCTRRGCSSPTCLLFASMCHRRGLRTSSASRQRTRSDAPRPWPALLTASFQRQTQRVSSARTRAPCRGGRVSRGGSELLVAARATARRAMPSATRSDCGALAPLPRDQRAHPDPQNCKGNITAVPSVGCVTQSRAASAVAPNLPQIQCGPPASRPPDCAQVLTGVASVLGWTVQELLEAMRPVISHAVRERLVSQRRHLGNPKCRPASLQCSPGHGLRGTPPLACGRALTFEESSFAGVAESLEDPRAWAELRITTQEVVSGLAAAADSNPCDTTGTTFASAATLFSGVATSLLQSTQPIENRLLSRAAASFFGCLLGGDQAAASTLVARADPPSRVMRRHRTAEAAARCPRLVRRLVAGQTAPSLVQLARPGLLAVALWVAQCEAGRPLARPPVPLLPCPATMVGGFLIQLGTEQQPRCQRRPPLPIVLAGRGPCSILGCSTAEAIGISTMLFHERADVRSTSFDGLAWRMQTAAFARALVLTARALSSPVRMPNPSAAWILPPASRPPRPEACLAHAVPTSSAGRACFGAGTLELQPGSLVLRAAATVRARLRGWLQPTGAPTPGSVGGRIALFASPPSAPASLPTLAALSVAPASTGGGRCVGGRLLSTARVGGGKTARLHHSSHRAANASSDTPPVDAARPAPAGGASAAATPPDVDDATDDEDEDEVECGVSEGRNDSDNGVEPEGGPAGELPDARRAPKRPRLATVPASARDGTASSSSSSSTTSRGAFAGTTMGQGATNTPASATARQSSLMKLEGAARPQAVWPPVTPLPAKLRAAARSADMGTATQEGLGSVHVALAGGALAVAAVAVAAAPSQHAELKSSVRSASGSARDPSRPAVVRGPALPGRGPRLSDSALLVLQALDRRAGARLYAARMAFAASAGRAAVSAALRLGDGSAAAPDTSSGATLDSWAASLQGRAVAGLASCKEAGATSGDGSRDDDGARGADGGADRSADGGDAGSDSVVGRDGAIVCWSGSGPSGTAGALATAAEEALAGLAVDCDVPARVGAGRLPGEVLSSTASWVRAGATSNLSSLGAVPGGAGSSRQGTLATGVLAAWPNAALLATPAGSSEASLRCWVVRSRPLELPLQLVEPVPSASTARERRLAAKRERRGGLDAAGAGGGALLRLQESLAGQQVQPHRVPVSATEVDSCTAPVAGVAPPGGGSSADPTPEQGCAGRHGDAARGEAASANVLEAGKGGPTGGESGEGAGADGRPGGGKTPLSWPGEGAQVRPKGLVKPAVAVPHVHAIPSAPAREMSSGAFAWPGASSIAPPSPGVAAGRLRRGGRQRQAQQVPRQHTVAWEASGAPRMSAGATRPSLTSGRPVGGLVGRSMRVGGFTIPTSLEAVAAVLRGLPAQLRE